MPPVTIPTLVATSLARSAPKGVDLRKQDLADAISEVTLRTQIYGASTLVVTMADPEWGLLTSGLFGVSSDGILSPLEVNYPDGSHSWWRLCMLDCGTDLNGPNLTLTFQDRIVAYLQEKWGPRSVPPGTASMPRFVQLLVNEVKANGGIRFVCPAIAKNLPSAFTPVGVPKTSSTAKSTDWNRVLSKFGVDAQDRKTNAKKGIGNGANITIKGQKPTTQQLADLNTALDEADTLKAGPLATQALICGGIGESNFDRNRRDGVTGTHVGIWQSNQIPGDQVATQAHYFLIGGRSFGGGGAIALAKTESDAGIIAGKVEVSGRNLTTSDPFYGMWLPEAKTIIAAYGGVKAGAQDASDLPANDTSQLSRGTTDNPDEDSWDCITRLAQARNWRAFSNADALYLASDPQLVSRKPSLYIDRKDNRWVTTPHGGTATYDTVASVRATVDNSALIYQNTKKRSRVAKPETPSQVLLDLVCGISDYHAGEVFYFHQTCGPLFGRWIVADATRNALSDVTTQFTLIPPTAPTPETQVSGGTIDTTGVTQTGNGAGVVAAAKKALANKGNYRYQEVRPIPSSLFGTPPITTDCSGFVTLCYKAAGLGDPNHAGYDGSGNTGTLIAHAKRTNNPQPGDLVFYGGSTSYPGHVAILVETPGPPGSGGKVISHGSPGDPIELDALYRADVLGYYHPDVLDEPSHVGATASPGVKGTKGDRPT